MMLWRKHNILRAKNIGPKITYLCPTGELGGAEISMLDLISRLSDERLHISAILLNHGPLEKKLAELNVRCRVVLLPRQLRRLSRAHRPSLRQWLAAPFLVVSAIARLRWAILQEKPDIVISNGVKTHVLSPFATLFTGAKLIWHVRDLLGGGLLRRWLRLTARLFCSLVITNSSAAAERIRTAKTMTIHNGVDLDICESALPLKRQKDLHLPAQSYVIGTVGHLAPMKGFETLIDAAAKVIQQIPQAHFLIAGSAIYETHQQYERLLREMIRRRGLEDRVRLLGFRQDVPRLLATFDLFVLPSYSEGFGRVVAEALAAGCPVIATAVGGVPEIIRPQVHGLLVPPRNDEALAEAIVKLAGNRALALHMADRGKQRIRQHFNLSRQALLFKSAVLSVLKPGYGTPIDQPPGKMTGDLNAQRDSRLAA